MKALNCKRAPVCIIDLHISSNLGWEQMNIKKKKICVKQILKQINQKKHKPEKKRNLFEK